MASEYRPPTMSLAHELHILQAQVEVFWPEEKHVLEHRGVLNAATILEIGCGPGYFTEKLLSLHPTVQLTALDANATLLQHAQALIGPTHPQVHFLQASAEAIPCADATFDLVIARLLYQHLPDPAQVTAEAQRVLRPGGKLLVIDLDDDLGTLISPPLQFDDLFTTLAQIQLRLTGPAHSERHIGRFLWRILQQASFTHLTLNTIVTHSDAIGLEPFRPLLEPATLPLLQQSADYTPHDIDRLLEPLTHFLQAPDSLVMAQLLAVSGSKPL